MPKFYAISVYVFIYYVFDKYLRIYPTTYPQKLWTPFYL